MVADAQESQSKRTWEFLLGMVQSDGAVPSQWQVSASGQIVPGQTVLSETQSLFMEYAVAVDNKECFDRIFSYV